MTVVGEPPKPTTQGGGRVFVMPGFFDAAGIGLVAGREFTERDRDGRANVAILNASMARFYFGSEVRGGRTDGDLPRSGRRKRTKSSASFSDFVRTSPRQGYVEFSNFFPYRHHDAINRGQQSRLRVMLIAIRATGEPLAIAEAVRSEIREIDPALPVLRINTTEQQLDDVLALDRLVASLASALGGIAMFLASLGIFGLLSYRVARRTNEIGVRLAFGATRGSVLRMVLAESGRLVVAGMVVGMIAADDAGATRVVASLRRQRHRSVDDRRRDGAADVGRLCRRADSGPPGGDRRSLGRAALRLTRGEVEVEEERCEETGVSPPVSPCHRDDW